MKRLSLTALFSAAVLAMLSAVASVQPLDEPAPTLKPAAEQRYASRLATRFIAGYNYPRTSLDKALSERIFDQYIRALDPNRVYFLAADIDDLERYRTHLDDALKNAELDPAYDIFNRYVRRVGERVQYAKSLLDQGFDFDVDEEYRFDRTELPWAADHDELNEIWRQRVKNDWLRLRLADQGDDEIRETLGKRYQRLHQRFREWNSEDVFQFFMNAFARSVEPHSAYMSPRSSDNFEISMSLSLEGIGALLQRDDTEHTTVQRVVPGGPADRDGRLQAGDRIVAVGQDAEGELVEVVGWRLDDVVELIRGPKETVVRLEVLPAETGLNGPAEIIRLERGEVRLEEQAASRSTIEIDHGEEGSFSIGVIRVPVFYVDFAGRARNKPNYRSSTRDVRRLVNELRAEGVDGIVIDLRDNGGGALMEATTMTGLFIDEGPVVQVRDRSGRINVETDREPGMSWDGPLAVLVNRNSASASEIFAAAIQDYGRGVVLGEPTYGKGTVQNLIDLDEFSQSEGRRLGQVKLTMAQFFRISGGSTQTKGVVPDLLLPSAGNPDDYGESALEFALPWSQIDPATFSPLAELSPLVGKAESRHRTRLSEDEELKRLLEELDEWERLTQRTSLSLQESVRRTEMEEAESRRKARFGHRELEEALTENGADEDSEAELGVVQPDGSVVNGDDEPDILLTESARILADMIYFDRDRQLLAQRNPGDVTSSLQD